jgi:hypothetical protein
MPTTKSTTKPSLNPGRHTLTRPGPSQETIDDSEVFDDLPEDTVTVASGQASKKATGKKAAISQPNPSVPSELATTQGRTAFDVRFFFNIPDKTCYRCMWVFFLSTRPLLKYIIREYFEEKNIPENQQWNATYKPSTGYTALRGHLEHHHKDEYLKACQENGWKVMLPSWLKKEKATHDATLQEAQASRVPFSTEEFLQHLVNWIVADDQVRIHLIISSYFI